MADRGRIEKGRVEQADVDFYREQGYLVAEGLVEPTDVKKLQEDLVLLCRGHYAHPALPVVEQDVTDTEALQNYLCLHQVHKLSPVMLNTGVRHRGMAGVLSRIISPDVKCMQSMLFIKPQDFPGQAWHQDELSIPTRDRSLCGGWIALDDATVENGCLWILPGSHKSGRLYEQREHNNPDEFDSARKSYEFDDSGEIPVEVKTGDVVFFHGYLLHRSQKNRSKTYRRVLVNHYMNAWSLLPWGRPDVSVGRADYRDIVMVHGKDPYAYKGTEDMSQVYSRACNIVAGGKT